MYLLVNFKENFNLEELKQYIKEVTPILDIADKNSLNIVFFPSSIYLHFFKKFIEKRCYKNIFLGSQDSSVFNGGSFTGEISAYQLKDFVSFSLVNHSERVKYFNEDLKMAGVKITHLLEKNIKPIVCVSTGEEALYFSDFFDKIFIAFEPSDFIGTSNFCGIPAIEKFYFDSKIASGFLYGGSVNESSVKLLIEYKKLNGLLVSSFCLKSSNFIDLVKILLQKQ